MNIENFDFMGFYYLGLAIFSAIVFWIISIILSYVFFADNEKGSCESFTDYIKRTGEKMESKIDSFLLKKSVCFFEKYWIYFSIFVFPVIGLLNGVSVEAMALIAIFYIALSLILDILYLCSRNLFGIRIHIGFYIISSIVSRALFSLSMLLGIASYVIIRMFLDGIFDAFTK